MPPAIDAYAELAITHRSELPDDPLGWVKAQVDADLAVVRGWWEQWVRCVVSLNAVVSFNTDVPAWINYPELHFALGRLPSDIELGAALPDAEGVLETIWIRFWLDLSKAVDVSLLDAQEKLNPVPTSKETVPTSSTFRPKTKLDRIIVQFYSDHPNTTQQVLREHLDHEGCQLPERDWRKLASTWHHAYLNPTLKQRVKSYLAKRKPSILKQKKAKHT